jgi:hypothetical protein
MQAEFDYFKDSGKWYASGVVDFEGTVYDSFVSAKDLIASGRPLPGLIGSWSGPIVVTIDELPRLYLPNALQGNSDA